MRNNHNNPQPDSSGRRHPRIPLVSFFAMVLLLRIAKQMRLLEHTAIVVVFAIGTLVLLARYIGTFVAMRRRGSE